MKIFKKNSIILTVFVNNLFAAYNNYFPNYLILNNQNVYIVNEELHANTSTKMLIGEKIFLEQIINQISDKNFDKKNNYILFENYINILYNLNSYNLNYSFNNLSENLLLEYIETAFNINLYYLENTSFIKLKLNDKIMIDFEYKDWINYTNDNEILIGTLNFNYHFTKLKNSDSSHSHISLLFYIEIINFYCSKMGNIVLSTFTNFRNKDYSNVTCKICNNFTDFTHYLILYSIKDKKIMINQKIDHEKTYNLPLNKTAGIVSKLYFIVLMFKINNFKGIIKFKINNLPYFHVKYKIKNNTFTGEYKFAMQKRIIHAKIFQNNIFCNDFVEICILYDENTPKISNQTVYIDQDQFIFEFKKKFIANFVFLHHNSFYFQIKKLKLDNFNFALPKLSFNKCKNKNIYEKYHIKYFITSYTYNHFKCAELKISYNGGFNIKFYNYKLRSHKIENIQIYCFNIESVLEILKFSDKIENIKINSKSKQLELWVLKEICAFPNLKNLHFYGSIFYKSFDALKSIGNINYTCNIFIDCVDNIHIFDQLLYKQKKTEYNNMTKYPKKLIFYNGLFIGHNV